MSGTAGPGIDPEDAALQIIDSESVWPASIACFLMDGLPAFSTHGCSFDPRQAGVPVRPEEDPKHNMGATLGIKSGNTS